MIKKLIFKHSKWSAIFISAFIASIISVAIRYCFLNFFHLDLLEVCDYPLICFIVMFKINIARFLIRFNLESLFADKYNKLIFNDFFHSYHKLPMGPSNLDNDYSNIPQDLQKIINMKTDNNNSSNNNSNNNSNNSIIVRQTPNTVSRTENNRRILNIIRGGPIGNNQGLPVGTIIRGNEAILPQGVRMHPSYNTTPNFNDIPTNNVHPSNNPATRPPFTIYASQRPNWGDSSNFPVGGSNGPFRIFDPENQIRNGYNRNAINQPALHNIAMALNSQILHAESAVTLSRDMFTPQQEKFILDHLQIVNRDLYIRLTGDNSMTGQRRTNIRWSIVTNNSSFIRNFPLVNYQTPNTN